MLIRVGAAVPHGSRSKRFGRHAASLSLKNSFDVQTRLNRMLCRSGNGTSSVPLNKREPKTIERAVEQGSLDIGVVVMPTDEERFNAFPFVRENLRLLLHPGHRLAGRERVELIELAEERFILFAASWTRIALWSCH